MFSDSSSSASSSAWNPLGELGAQTTVPAATPWDSAPPDQGGNPQPSSIAAGDQFDDGKLGAGLGGGLWGGTSLLGGVEDLLEEDDEETFGGACAITIATAFPVRVRTALLLTSSLLTQAWKRGTQVSLRRK